MRDNCESALAELDATLAEVKRDRDEEWTRLKAALAAMTAERDGLQGELARRKTELHLQGKQLDIEFRGRVAAEAKLEAVEMVLAQWREQTWVYTRGEVIRRTCIEEIEGALKTA